MSKKNTVIKPVLPVVDEIATEDLIFHLVPLAGTPEEIEVATAKRDDIALEMAAMVEDSYAPSHREAVMVTKRGKGRPSQNKAARSHTFDFAVAHFLDEQPDNNRSTFVNDAVIASEAFQQSPHFEQWKQSPAYERWLKRNEK